MFAHTNVKSRQLRSKLKSITKVRKKLISKYLVRVQCTILESIDDPMSHTDQLESILDGLPDEFNALDSTIQYLHIMCSIIEVEFMLLDHEAKLERTRKNVLTEPLFVNVAPLVPTPTQTTN